MKRMHSGMMGGAIAAVAAFAATPIMAGSADPSLWRVEAVGQKARPVYMCTNAGLRAALLEAVPEVNGEACVATEPARRSAGRFQVRCRTSGVIAVASSVIQGDQARDFTVNTRISTRPADPSKARPQGEFAQIRHYARLGACPAGWGVGDTAAPGDKAVVNSRTSKRHALPTPFKPPL